MMYNINLNYIKWLENTDVKVLPIFEFQTKSCVTARAIFENLCMVCWRGVLYHAILSCVF
jgi:hypothetical protein